MKIITFEQFCELKNRSDWGAQKLVTDFREEYHDLYKYFESMEKRQKQEDKNVCRN